MCSVSAVALRARSRKARQRLGEAGMRTTVSNIQPFPHGPAQGTAAPQLCTGIGPLGHCKKARLEMRKGM